MTVDYATADGTATAADSDYTADQRHAHLRPGQTRRRSPSPSTATRSTRPTRRSPSTSRARATRRSPTATATGTITNDDAAPSLVDRRRRPSTEGNRARRRHLHRHAVGAPAARPSRSTTRPPTARRPRPAATTRQPAARSPSPRARRRKTSPSRSTATRSTSPTRRSPSTSRTRPTRRIVRRQRRRARSPTTTRAVGISRSATSRQPRATAARRRRPSPSRCRRRAASTVTVDYATADGTATAAGATTTPTSGTLTFTPGQTTQDRHRRWSTATRSTRRTRPSPSTCRPRQRDDRPTGQGTGTITDDDAAAGAVDRRRHRDRGQRRHDDRDASPSRLSARRAARPSPSTTPPPTARPPRPATTRPPAARSPSPPARRARRSPSLVNGDTARRARRDLHRQPLEPVERDARRRHRRRARSPTTTRPSLVDRRRDASPRATRGTRPSIFTVSLGAASGKTVTVDYATADGTATRRGDYTADERHAHLRARPDEQDRHRRSSTATRLDEADETFTLNLSSAANATLCRRDSGTGTIIDDDPPPSARDQRRRRRPRATAGTTDAIFTVTPRRRQRQDRDGQLRDRRRHARRSRQRLHGQRAARSPSRPGETTKTVTVMVNGDTLVRARRDVQRRPLERGRTPTIADAQGVGTITNDDAQPVVASTTRSTSTEGNRGANASFTVTLTRPQRLDRHRQLRDGRRHRDRAAATTPPTSGTLTFTPGQTTKTVDVPVVNDALDEADEAFTLVLSGPSNAVLGDGSGARRSSTSTIRRRCRSAT